jgi:hypothetical protein
LWGIIYIYIYISSCIYIYIYIYSEFRKGCPQWIYIYRNMTCDQIYLSHDFIWLIMQAAYNISEEWSYLDFIWSQCQTLLRLSVSDDLRWRIAWQKPLSNRSARRIASDVFINSGNVCPFQYCVPRRNQTGNSLGLRSGKFPNEEYFKSFKHSLVKNIYLDELSTASLQSSTGRLIWMMCMIFTVVYNYNILTQHTV